MEWKEIINELFEDESGMNDLIDSIRNLNVTNVIYHDIDVGNYYASYHLVYELDGKIYYASDSHCSCDGCCEWYPEVYESREFFIEVAKKWSHYGYYKKFEILAAMGVSADAC